MSNASIEGKINNSKEDLHDYLKDIDEAISSLSKLRSFILDILGMDDSIESSIEEPIDEPIDSLVDESIHASDELAKKIDLLLEKVDKKEPVMSNEVAHDEVAKKIDLLIEKMDEKKEPPIGNEVANVEVAKKIDILIEKMSEKKEQSVGNEIAHNSLEMIKLFQTSQSAILSGISEKIDSLMDKKNEELMNNEVAHKCAPVLGLIGEEDIVDNLNVDFPNMFVRHVSNISHQCDIHVEDPISNILYMIEVKNKISITKEDIDKFESDVDKSENKRTIGLFISLNCENIPGKISQTNPFNIDSNKIYMIGYNKEILSLIFTIISKFIFANNEVDVDKDITLLCQRVKAIQETRQKRIVAINSNINSLKTVILNEEAMKYELEPELQLLGQCDAFVESNCGNCNAINSASSDEKKALIEYIKLNKNSFTKKILLTKFPLQSTFIKSKTIAELKELE